MVTTYIIIFLGGMFVGTGICKLMIDYHVKKHNKSKSACDKCACGTCNKNVKKDESKD